MNIYTVNRLSIAIAISGAALILGKMVSLWILRQYTLIEIGVYSLITSVPYLFLVFASLASRRSRSAAIATYVGALGTVGLGMGITLNPMSDRYAWMALLAVPFWQFIVSLVVLALAAILAWRFKSSGDVRPPFQFSVASLLLGITAVGVLLGLTITEGIKGGMIVVLGVSAAMLVTGVALRRYGLMWSAIAEVVVGISLTGVLVGLFSPPALFPRTPIILTKDTPYHDGQSNGVFKAGTTVWFNAQTDTEWLVYDANHTEGFISKDSVK